MPSQLKHAQIDSIRSPDSEHNAARKAQSHLDNFRPKRVTYKWFSIETLSEKFKPLFSRINSSIGNFLLLLVEDKNILDLRQQCHNAEKLQKIMSFNIHKKNKNSGTFRHFRPIMKIPLIVRKSRNFVRNTVEQIRSYQLKPWRKKRNQKLWRIENFNKGTCRIYNHFLGILENQKTDPKIKIQHSSIE